jgi:uncharacterized protein YndB with AHSA1/START domain
VLPVVVGGGAEYDERNLGREERPMKSYAGVGNEAVKARTGRDWAEWLRVLDKAGAMMKDHKEIVAVLKEQHGLGAWWCQMVTVGYEQARGLRQAHQKTGGFAAGVSRTFAAPVEAVYAEWSDPARRSAWLDAPGMVIRKATENKSLRITWTDGTSSVDVNFYPKGPGKCQLQVEHSKLATEADVARVKALWGGALAALKSMVEG